MPRVIAPALPEPVFEVVIWELDARERVSLVVVGLALRVIAPALPEELLVEVILELLVRLNALE